MPDKREKEKRRQILEALRKKQDEDFEASLPISRENFEALFDYLDAALEEKECDDMHTFTFLFLKKSGIVNAEPVVEWLKNNGGYCDCEVLLNVEEKFE